MDRFRFWLQNNWYISICDNVGTPYTNRLKYGYSKESDNGQSHFKKFDMEHRAPHQGPRSCLSKQNTKSLCVLVMDKYLKLSQLLDARYVLTSPTTIVFPNCLSNAGLFLLPGVP